MMNFLDGVIGFLAAQQIQQMYHQQEKAVW
jgi:hypothetical protein